jgi:hypothetical protein
MYKKCPIHPIFGDIKSIIRTIDGACIPADPDNTDYQAYLKFLEEGGVPLPADE